MGGGWGRLVAALEVHQDGPQLLLCDGQLLFTHLADTLYCSKGSREMMVQGVWDGKLEQVLEGGVLDLALGGGKVEQVLEDGVLEQVFAHGELEQVLEAGVYWSFVGGYVPLTSKMTMVRWGASVPLTYMKPGRSWGASVPLTSSTMMGRWGASVPLTSSPIMGRWGRLCPSLPA